MEMVLNWPWLACFAIIAGLAAHLGMWMIRYHPGPYRASVYSAFLLGGISLLTALYESDAQLAHWAEPNAEARRDSAVSLLTSQLEWQRGYYCDTKFERSEYSPPDFDEIVQDQTEACRLTKQALNRAPDWLNGSAKIHLPEFESRAFRRPPDRSIILDLTNLRNSANEAVAELKRLQEISNPSPFKITINVLGPYLLIVAFAIGLASIAFPEKTNPAGKLDLSVRGRIRRKFVRVAKAS